MTTSNQRLNFSKLDKSLITWGVAHEVVDGYTVAKYAVTAYPTRDLAAKTARTAPRVSVVSQVPGYGPVVSQFEPLVYHHPDLGWVLAAVGWSIPT
jgi:hypothetical protein